MRELQVSELANGFLQCELRGVYSPPTLDKVQPIGYPNRVHPILAQGVHMSIGISVTFKDEANKEASTSFNVPSATTAANAAFAAQAWMLLADAISDGKIVAASMTLPVSLPAGLKADPIDGSRVGVGARFQWNTSGGFLTRFILPARRESIILDETDVVDETDPDVANMIAEMTAGLDLTTVGGVGTVQPTDTRNEDVASLDEAYETIGGKRRQS